jgi:hypothetical protein
MKTAFTFLVIALALVAAVPAGGAAADGGGLATVLVGGQGVRAPDGKVRYVALTTGRQTILSVVRSRGGQVVRWRVIPGYFGVPLVAVDGTTDGVSRDGRFLVLATLPGGSRSTQFALIETKTLRLERITLPGSWSFDAISPDATTLYLVEYSGTGPSASYRVRAYDVAARRLLPNAIVDRTVGEKLMIGQAVTRETTGDGRWAYTLYAKPKYPFVHALDSVQRKALCIDLPVKLSKTKQMALRLRLRGGRTLEVRNGAETVAAVDTRTFEVHKH